ncbi:MAG: 4'-phosphopantetheinyl transferase superfamily protein [Methylocystis sp.]
MNAADFRIGTTDAQVFALLLDVDDLAPTPRDLVEAPQGASREAFLRRRAATRRPVAQRLGVAASAVEIGHDPQGAPRLLAPQAPLFLSVSGREDFCAIALGSRAVGVDIEPLEPEAKPVWSALHASEAAWLCALPKDAQSEAFLRLWTAKEAYLKALGTGFSRDPATIAVDFDFRLFVEGAEVALAAGEWRTVELGGRKYIVACIVNSSDA